MKIKKLVPGMRGMFVDGTIADISEPRTINTRDGPRSVADATLEDKTGRIKLSLWEDMIEKVKVGDEVTISGAYVKEFRGELQLNISRSGTLETQDDRIAEWIGRVKGWIDEDIKNFLPGGVIRRSEVGALYDDVHARNLTLEELLGSKLPDEYLWDIAAVFVSEENRKYRVEYFTSRSARYDDMEHPYFMGGLASLDVSSDGTKEDVRYVKDIFAGEPHLQQLRTNPGEFYFDLRESPTQSGVADVFRRHRMHLREVSFDLHFREVPKQVFQNSGFPSEKLSFSIAKKKILDDDDYDDYMQGAMNKAIRRLLRSFPHAAGKYRGGEEGFLYYYEDADAVPKGIEWMNEEADRWPSSVVKRKVREMGEAYKQVIEEVILRKKGLAPIKTEGEPIALTPPEFGVEDLPSGWQLGGDPPFRAWPDGLYSGYRRAFHLRDPARTRAISGEGEDLDLIVMLFGDVSSATDYYAVQRREDLTATGEVYKSPAAENETTDEDGTYCSFEHPFAERGRRTFWFVKGIKGNVYYSYILEKWRPKTWTRTIRRSVSAEPAFPLLDIRQTLVGRIELS